MIEFPRSLARRLRTVLRHSSSAAESQREVPVVVCRAGPHGLVLEATRNEVAFRCQVSGARPEGALAFPASLLAQIEGRKEDAVRLERASATTGQAHWQEDGTARTVEFELVPLEKVPAFPDVPRRFTPMPSGFAQALADGIRSTAKDAVRYALTRVQLRGREGALVGTDGRQLLMQTGFPMPWSDDLLVPAIPALALRDGAEEGTIGLGRTRTHVALRQGAWTFLLRIDRHGKFPNTEHVIPPATVIASRLRLDAADVAAVTQALLKLPKQTEEQPVTLELGPSPTLRFRTAEEGPVTEVALSRSTASGKAVRVESDRRYLLRALQLGFTEIHVRDASSALFCRDAQRTYVWMPLTSGSVPAARAESLRVPEASAEPSPEPRRPIMPTPSTNGHRPDDERRNPTSSERPSLEELITEAEALRTQLADAAQRTTRLVAALKQQRRHSRVLRSAIDSLRELKLGP